MNGQPISSLQQPFNALLAVSAQGGLTPLASSVTAANHQQGRLSKSLSFLGHWVCRLVKNVSPLGAMVGVGYLSATALACCIPFLATIVVGAASGVVAGGVTCKAVGLLSRAITRARPVSLQQQVHQQIAWNLAIAEAFEGTQSPVNPTRGAAKRPAKPSAQINAPRNDQTVKVVNTVVNTEPSGMLNSPAGSPQDLQTLFTHQRQPQPLVPPRGNEQVYTSSEPPVTVHRSHNRQQLSSILTTPPAIDRFATSGEQTGVATRDPMSPDDLMDKVGQRREAAFQTSLHNHLSWDNSSCRSAKIPDIVNACKQSDLSTPGASGTASEPMEVDHEKFLGKANEFLKQMGKSLQEHREWLTSPGNKTVNQQSSESNQSVIGT